MTYQGRLRGDGLRVAVVCSRFNDLVTQRLLAGARDGLVRHGVDEGSITVAWVPGAFELPLVAARLAQSEELDAIVCLGAVVRGETDHYEHVATQCAAGVQRAQLDAGVPVILVGDSVGNNVLGAGSRAGRREGRQQGLRGRRHGHRDGRPGAPAPQAPAPLRPTARC